MDVSRDAEIVRQVCAGDRERYRDLVEAYQTKVYAIAFCRLRNADLAEEAVQEAFVLAFQMLRSLRKPDLFGPWLCRITRRVVSSVFRKRSLRQRGASEALAEQESRVHSEKPETQLERREVAGILREALDRLPKDLAETLTLFYIQENSVTETARLLGISESAVKTRLFRGREMLREPLEKVLTEELRNLKPSGNLCGAVMAVLSAVPDKVGWGSMIAGSLMSPFVFFSSGFGLGMWLQVHLFQKSFRNPTDYRARIDRKQALLVIGMILAIFILAGPALHLLGKRGYLAGLGLFCAFFALIQLPTGVRLWRMGIRPFLASNLIFLAIGILYLCEAGFDLSSVWMGVNSFGFMLMVLLVAGQAQLMRRDQNLFLRAIKNELPEGSGDVDIHKRWHLLQDGSFTRFLSRQFLLWGATWSTDGDCILSLVPVKNNSFFPLLVSSASKVYLRRDGKVTAWLSPRDRRHLEKMEGRTLVSREIEALETRVAGSVGRSLQQFSEGNMIEARKCLSTMQEQDIFVHGSYRKTPYFRFLVGSLVIVGVLVLIVLLICLFSRS